MADSLEQAREHYIAAREAMDALWPRYERTLALKPLTPGQPAPEGSADDREVSREWDAVTKRHADALDELKKWKGIEG